MSFEEPKNDNFNSIIVNDNQRLTLLGTLSLETPKVEHVCSTCVCECSCSCRICDCAS